MGRNDSLPAAIPGPVVMPFHGWLLGRNCVVGVELGLGYTI
jgi:hypothetical protein